MEFRILGPLEVVEDGKPVALGTLKERLVLGVLLLHANEFVSRERLIDDLWGEAPPPTARKATNVYVSHLRKALGRGGDDTILTASGGYRLQVEPEALDALRAERLLAGALKDVAQGEHGRAAEHFQSALSLWRGPTLAGLQLESRGADEVARLDELRVAALMDRLDCDLALGRHEQLVGELNVLVREHPLRERLRAQQMLALYRAGRQAEALEAYAKARKTLVDDLGIEPSEGLQRLQQAILRHDPSLETPQGTAAVNGARASAASRIEPTAGSQASRQRTHPRRWPLAFAIALFLAASAAAAAVLLGSAAATPGVLPNSLIQLDPRTGKPLTVTPVGGLQPGPIAITRNAIWTANYGSDDVSRYDLRTHKVQTRGGITPGQPNDIAFDQQGDAWITNTPADDKPQPTSVVVRLEAGPGGTSPGPLAPSHLETISFRLPFAGYEAIGGNHVWVIVGGHGPVAGDNRVAVIDTLTQQLSRVITLDGSATSIAYGYATAWIGTYGANRGGPGEVRIEAFRAGQFKPQNIVLKKHGASWGPTWIAVGEGAVWALVGPVLYEIDPRTLEIVRHHDLAAEHPGVVAVGAGAVWVTGGLAGTGNSVTKIDPRSGQIIRTTPLANRTRVTCGMAATPSAVWVTLGSKACDTLGS